MNNQTLSIHQPFFDLIVALDSKNGIGFYNEELKTFSIPWNIEVDMKFFMDMTTCGNQNVIIMGRNTFLSMGSKQLNKRINIVITKTPIEGVLTCASLDEALEHCFNKIDNVDNVFVIGGRKLYNEAFNHNALRFAYITKINYDFKCNINLDFDFTHNLVLESERSKIFNLKEKNFNETCIVQFDKFMTSGKSGIGGYETGPKIENNLEENNYIKILEELTNASLRQTRNANTYSLFGKMISFNLKNKTYPILTTKRLSKQIIVEELLFFLRGETNSSKLSEKDIKIWEPNTSRKFLDKLGHTGYSVGDMGPMYGYQLRHFNAEYGSCKVDHKGKGVDQLKICLDLLKNDPTSRRILMTTFNPAQMYEGVLHPCHGIVIQFYVEEEKYLCCSMYQRSADIFLGFPINIASYALLTYIMCELVNNDKEYQGVKLEPGKVVISLGDYHLYESHYEAALRQILRPSKPFPKLNIKRKLSNIDQFTLDDFELLDYNPFPTIKAEMIA